MRRFRLAEIWAKNTRNPHGCSSGTWPLLSRTLVLTLVLLTACAGPAPTIPVVKVPVYRPCVTAAPARPEFATRTLAPHASDGEKILALARDLPVHLKYEAQLEAVIAGCL